MSSQSESLYIIIPAYNEAANIATVVDAWHPIAVSHGKASRLVIINDGSTDDTLKILQKLARKYPQLQVLDKPNSGHGATVLYGYRYALDAGADYIFQTDSDGQTNPDEFAGFWERRHDYDMIIGHRHARQDGFSRIVVTKTLKATVRAAFGVTITDANTPFRLMNRQSLKDCLEFVPPDFYLANVILSVAYTKQNYRVKYLPITFKPRQGGVNSINLKRIFGIGKQAIGDFFTINRKFKAQTKRKSLPGILIIALLALFAFLICMQSPLNPFYADTPTYTDSSVFRYVAQEMHAGHMPYVDTFDHKGPLLYLINYIGYLLSPHAGIWWVELLCMFVSLCLAYRIARRFLSQGTAIAVVSAVFSLLAVSFEGGNLTEEYALPFQFAAMDIFLQFFLNPKTSIHRLTQQVLDFKFILCGACLAAVLLLRPNMIAIWVIFCMMLFIYCLYHKLYRQLFRVILSFVIGGVIILAPVILWLALGGALSAFIDCYILFNLQYSTGVSNISRIQTAISFLSPLIVSLAFVAIVIRLFIQYQSRQRDWFTLGYLVLMCLALTFISLPAREYAHYGMTLLPILIYPYIILYSLVASAKSHDSARLLLSLYLVVVLALPTWLDLSTAALEKIKNRQLPPYSDAIIEYVASHTTADDYISVVGNSNYLYTYTQRLSASRYSYQAPIAEVDPEIAAEYLADLSHNQPKLVIIMSDNMVSDELRQNLQKFLNDNHYKLAVNNLPIYVRVD